MLPHFSVFVLWRRKKKDKTRRNINRLTVSLIFYYLFFLKPQTFLKYFLHAAAFSVLFLETPRGLKAGERTDISLWIELRRLITMLCFVISFDTSGPVWFRAKTLKMSPKSHSQPSIISASTCLYEIFTVKWQQHKDLTKSQVCFIGSSILSELFRINYRSSSDCRWGCVNLGSFVMDLFESSVLIFFF